MFKNNFVPFILKTNMRAFNDKLYCAFLSKCRIGDYDFPYIQSRICGEGHPFTNECENMFDSVTICSLNKNRKELLMKTLETYLPNQTKVLINSVDTYENGSIVSEYLSKKNQNHQAHLKKH